MKQKKSKKDEIKLFKEYSNEWWDKNGKFKILHKINPLRIDYILGQIKNNFSKIIVNTKRYSIDLKPILCLCSR